jgi:hypothetical protein
MARGDAQVTFSFCIKLTNGSIMQNQGGAMKKQWTVVAALVMFLLAAGCACAVSAETPEDDDGRYQVYATQTLVILCDTRTGKLWKITSDMAGRLKAEGVSVDGLAYAQPDEDTVAVKLKEISLDDVDEKYKKKCREALKAQFTYALDDEKIARIVNPYRKLKEE